ncbi:hypothetical protein CO660_25815 [Rhizobium sp. L9]|uniref:hypothetical protein n=1 Tax=Rhizobium sp. L9 TaxID=1340738 RepID=UPI000BEA3F9A|nr:hypothetical protein [Rhizobium sp. L9]PDT26885.1 hypothetical protein CO660_25815 [Rhizobium sp. L9]
MTTLKSANGKEGEADKEMRRQLWELLSAMLVTFLIAVLVYGFSWVHAEGACYLASNSIYMGIWPPNLRDANVLLEASYPVPDSCILLSTRSMISAIMLIYLFYLFVSQTWVKDASYIPKLIPISVFLTLGYLYIATKAISTEPASLYSTSTHSGVVVNLIKSYIEICGLYLGFALFVQRMFALLRLKHNAGRAG